MSSRILAQESAQQVHEQDLKRPKKQTAAEPQIKVLNYKILSHHRRLTDQSIQTEIAAGTDGRLVKDAARSWENPNLSLPQSWWGKNAKNNQRMYKSMKAKRQVCSLSKCRIFTVTSHQYKHQQAAALAAESAARDQASGERASGPLSIAVAPVPGSSVTVNRYHRTALSQTNRYRLPTHPFHLQQHQLMPGGSIREWCAAGSIGQACGADYCFDEPTA